MVGHQKYFFITQVSRWKSSVTFGDYAHTSQEEKIMNFFLSPRDVILLDLRLALKGEMEKSDIRLSIKRRLCAQMQW